MISFGHLCDDCEKGAMKSSHPFLSNGLISEESNLLTHNGHAGTGHRSTGRCGATDGHVSAACAGDHLYTKDAIGCDTETASTGSRKSGLGQRLSHKSKRGRVRARDEFERLIRKRVTGLVAARDNCIDQVRGLKHSTGVCSTGPSRRIRSARRVVTVSARGLICSVGTMYGTEHRSGRTFVSRTAGGEEVRDGDRGDNADDHDDDQKFD